MNRQMLELMQQRGELLAKIAAQRELIAATAERWETPLQAVDRGISIVRFLHAHPLLVAAAAAILVIRRRRLFGTLTSGWRLWRLYRKAMSFAAKMAARPHPQ